MRKMLQFIAVAAVVALCLQALPAFAASGSVTDPNDVSGKLDLMTLSFTRSGKTAPLTITVTTYNRWRSRILRAGGDRLAVFIDTNNDGVKNFKARIKKTGGHLVAVITGSGSTFEPLPATRPDPKSVKFTIPGNTPPNPRGHVPHFRAFSRFVESSVCTPTKPCIDFAPDTGWL